MYEAATKHTGRPEHGSHSAGDHEIHAADVRGVLLFCLIRPLPLLDRAKRVVHHPNQDDQGGSNAMGLFYPFLDDNSVKIIGVEAGGKA